MATLPVVLDARLAKSGAAEAERAFDKTTRAAKRTDKSVNKLDKDLAKTGKTAGRLKKAFVSAVAGFSAFMVIRDITGVVSNFGQEMSTLQAVTDASIDQMAEFEDQARSLGATTRFSATEAAEGMTFLARAGFETTEVLAAIPDTLDLAIAGALDLGTAADIASNVLSQFNLAAAETGRVGDILVKTANSANTSVGQLAEALKLAGPVAGALDIALEETSAAIGVLGDSGIQGSLAGTNLRGVMSALLGPTSAAKGALKDMGIAIEDLNPETNSLTDIFGKFGEANLSAADAVEIFGRRNAAAALILSGNVDRLAELTEETLNAENTSKDAAKIMQDNLAGSFKTLRSTIEEAYNAIGDKGFTGALRGTVDTVTDAIRILLGMQAGAEGVGVAAKALAGAIRGVTTGLVALAAIKTVAYFQALQIGTIGLAGAMLKLRIAMMAHPIVAIAAAAGIAATAFAIFIGKTEAATEGVRTLDLVTSDLVKNVEAFAAAQKLIDKGSMFGRAEDEAAGAQKQVSILENVLFDLKKELDEGEGGDIWKNFFALKAVGVEIDDFKSNVDSLSETTQNALGKSTALYKIPLEDAIVAVESALKDMAEAADSADISLSEIQDDIQSQIDAAIAIKESTDAREAQIQAIKDERELLSQDAALREITIAKREAEKNMIGLTDEERRKYLETLEEEIRKNQELVRAQGEREAYVENEEKLAKTREEGRIAMESYLGALMRETDMISVGNDQKELMEALQHAANIATETGTEFTKDHISAIADEITAQQGLRAAKGKTLEATRDKAAADRKAAAELQRAADEAERAAERWARPFVDAVGDIITANSSLEDSFENLYKAISQMALQQFLLDPLQGGLAGLGTRLFAANGAVFDATSNLVPFSDGGVVKRPTLFPFANGGKIGLMGEAGPEAIMPLKKTPSGKLGVEMVGVSGGGGGGRGAMTVNQFITTSDADSFRKSKRQIANDARRGLE